MNIQAKLLLWLLSVAIVLGSLFASYRYGRHVENIEQTVARDKAVIEQIAKNDALKTKLEVKHADDQKQIDALAADLRAIRVRLPPRCSNTVPAAGSAGQTAGSQPLPVDPQIALDAFERGLGELAKEADNAIANCRVVMEWARQESSSLASP